MKNHMIEEIRRIRLEHLREYERDPHAYYEESRRRSLLSGHDIVAFRDGRWHTVYEAPPELKARNAQLCPDIDDIVAPRMVRVIRQRKRAERERLAKEEAERATPTQQENKPS